MNEELAMSRTIFSKCYYHVSDRASGNKQTPQKKDVSSGALQEHFLVTTYKGVSDFWDVYDVTITRNAQENEDPVYHFSRAKTDMSAKDVFNLLAQFEKQQDLDGYAVKEGFSYPNALSLEKAAAYHGLVKDIDTATYISIVNAAIPVDGGSFTEKDLSKAANEVATRQKETTHESLIDTMFQTYQPSAVNFEDVFRVVGFGKKMELLYEAVKACIEYMVYDIKDDGSGEYVDRYASNINREFDVTKRRTEYSSCYINYLDKSWGNAFAAAQKIVGELDLTAHPEVKAFMKETLLALDVSWALMKMQQRIKANFSGTKVLEESVLRTEITKLEKKYKGRLSEDQICSMERAYLDTNNISVPRVLHDVESQIMNMWRKSEEYKRKYLSDTIRGSAAHFEVSAVYQNYRPAPRR